MTFPAQRKIINVSETANQSVAIRWTQQNLCNNGTLHDPAILERPTTGNLRRRRKLLQRGRHRGPRGARAGLLEAQKRRRQWRLLEIYYIQGYKSAKWLAMPSSTLDDHCATINYPAQRKSTKCETVNQARFVTSHTSARRARTW